MLELTRRLPPDPARVPEDVLELPFDLRQKSRLRARLQSGEEVAVVLPRGDIMRGGDVLTSEAGRRVGVVAAPEDVSEVRCDDSTTLARLAYHLGNRHVALQVGEGFLRYQHDHVLDDMVRALGGAVTSQAAPFEPEAGAYGHAHPHHHHHHHHHDPA